MPAINIDDSGNASIVHRDPSDKSGKKIVEKVRLYNAVSGNEQILTGGKVTIAEGKWHTTLNPLTVIGLAGGKVVILIVDGRQPHVSEGLNLREAAELLRNDYAVTDAINLDGGGSTTLCIADPTPRVVNRTVGLKNVAQTLRPVGSNLAIFARAKEAAPATMSGQ